MTKNLLSDTELWAQIKLDDKKAFDLLFDRYWSAIYTTAFIYLKDVDNCKELTHDIFLNIWQKRDVLEIKSLKNYLTSAARYHVYKIVKKEKLNPIQLIEDYNTIADEHCSVNLGEEKLLYTELEQDIEKILGSLPKRCKEIFVLSRINHLSNNEISDKLGISKRTVENQLTYALKVLRVSLKSIPIILLFYRL